MKKTVKSILLSFFVSMVPLLYNCGSATDVSDESKIIGHLYMPDGKQPASDTKVVLRSQDYLSPLHGSKDTSSDLISPCSTWTNAGGEYAFVINRSIPAGSYMIEAADNNGNCALIDSINVDITIIENNSDLTLPEDTLKPGSRIQGKININQDSANFVVCIPGLDRYTNVAGDGTFTFENIPEGNLRIFVENVNTEQPSSAPVVVKTVANQTTTVDTPISVGKKYVLSLTTNETGTVTGADSVEQGVEHVITAVANSGWAFSVWKVISGNVEISDSLSASTTVILQNGNAEIEAVFTSTPPVNSFSLHLSSNGHGKINGKASSIDTTITSGTPFTVTAVANADYFFQSWHISEGSAVIADTLSPTTTITLNNGPADIRAVFTSTPPVDNSFSLHLSSNGYGKINGKASSIDTTITSGTPFTVTAVANADYFFQSWHISEGSAVIADTLSPTTTITLNNSPADIRAVFTSTPPVNRFSLHLSSNGYGKINGKAGSIDTTITSGTPFSVTAVANADYFFQSWHIYEGSAVIADTSSPTTTITLNNGPADIRAVFGSTPPVDNSFSLHLSSNGHGKINGKASSIDTTITSGTPFSVTAVANADYYFQSWHISEGSAVIADTLSATTTITLNNSPADIRAVFSSTPPQNTNNPKYNLMLTTAGSGNVEGPDSLEKGVSGTIKATPAADWYFINWRVVEGTAEIADPTSATTTVVLNNGTAQIEAVFSTSPVTGN